MTWDEGNAIGRAEAVSRWFQSWAAKPSGRRLAPLSRESIAAGWPYTTVIEGHPAFYGLLIAAGRAVAPGFLSPLSQARFGPLLLFSLAVGAMFYRLWNDFSAATAVVGTTALLTLPRLVAHAHFASIDGPLMSLWMLAWCAFPPARRGQAGAMAFGILLGMTMSTKATGWLAPVPFLVWAIVYRDRGALRAMMIGLPVALLTFVALNPPLWHQPLAGLARFLELNLHRAARPELNVSTQFLGRLYNLDFPLPWYNTLFWTAVAVPVGTLVLAGIGLIGALRQARGAAGAMLIVAHWSTLIIVRAMPFAPPHDGIRLFLPSFAFLAALAGVGGGRLWRWAADRRFGRLPGKPLAVAAWLVWSVVGLRTMACYWPQLLSHYNLLIGGLSGAVRRGMEPTYYWDSLDREVLTWINRHVPPGDKIALAAGPSESLALMRRWGMLTRDWRKNQPGEYRFYIIQCRPSAWRPWDRWLMEHATPVMRKTLRPPNTACGPWRWAVTLLEIFDIRQYAEARRRFPAFREEDRPAKGGQQKTLDRRAAGRHVR